MGVDGGISKAQAAAMIGMLVVAWPGDVIGHE